MLGANNSARLQHGGCDCIDSRESTETRYALMLASSHAVSLPHDVTLCNFLPACVHALRQLH